MTGSPGDNEVSPWPSKPGIIAPRLAEAWQYLVSALPGARARAQGGAVAVCTGVPLPSVNGVWQQSAEPDGTVVGQLFDEVAASGRPYSLQVRPHATSRLAHLAEQRGDSGAAWRPPDGPLEGPVAGTCGASGRCALLPRSSHRYHRPRARPTCLSLHAPGGLVVRSQPSHGAVMAGCGFASTIVSRAISDGLESGAGWAWLQSSPQGLSMYTRLGFATLEPWPTWSCTH